MLNYEILGKKIREYRTNLGYTQSELAEKISVEWSYLNRIESGEKLTPKDLKIREVINNVNSLNLNLYNEKFIISMLININKRR